MATQLPVSRPKVRGMVILTAFVGALNLLGVIILAMVADQTRVTPGVLVVNVLIFAMGMLMLFAAYLIANYKRLGLRIALGLYIPYLASSGYSLIHGEFPNLVGLIILVLVAASSYYMYRDLTHEPEKQSFT